MGPAWGFPAKLSPQLRQWHLNGPGERGGSRSCGCRWLRDHSNKTTAGSFPRYWRGDSPYQKALHKPVPHLDISELRALPTHHPQDPFIFRGEVSLARENKASIWES